MDIYDRIDAELNKMNMSRADLARGIDVAYDTLLRSFQRHAKSLKSDRIERIAAFLGKSVDYLITGKESPEASQKPQEAPKSYVQELYDNISEEYQKTIIQTLEMFYRVEHGSLPIRRNDVYAEDKLI